jgi:putative ABC transport system permease protein
MTMGMEHWIRDLRYAARALVRQPLFAIAAAGTLALGIGATTAVFSLVHGVLLAPLPLDEPERLARVYLEEPERPGGRQYLTAMDALLVRDQQDAVAEVAIFYDYQESGADLTGAGQAERVRTLPVSSGYFALQGAELLLGRELMRSEELEDARVAVVSHAVWTRHLGADPDALGRGLRLDGRAYTVVGVLPAGFRDPVAGAVDVYVPQDLDPANDWNNWDNHYVSAVARLAPGVTLEEASERIRGVALAANQQVRDDPESYWLPRLVPLQEDVVGEARTMLWVLMGAVGLVLLLACANVANLTLARGAGRTRELAVRSALGAGRGGLARQLFCESALVALLGAAVGVALAGGALVGVRWLAADRLPRIDTVGIDFATLSFTVSVTLLCALVFGLLPALGSGGADPSGGTLQGARGNAPAAYRLRRALVAAQLALAVVLLIGAGVLARSFAALQHVELGVDVEDVLTYEVHLPEARYPEAAARTALHEELQERVGALPGVRTAGAIHWLPVQGRGYSWGFFREDPPEGVEPIGADVRVIQGEYLAALDVPRVTGRTFGLDDVADGQPVVVVNQETVRRVFPESDPIGARVRIGGVVRTIVGVVGDVAHDPLGRVSAKVYLPLAQMPTMNWAMKQVVEADVDPAGLVEPIRAVLADLDPNLVLHRPRTMTDVLGEGLVSQRLAVTVMAGFAGLALALAMIGIYGVLAFLVGRRAHEIGIRMALGAERSDVRALVIRESLALSLAGIALGVLGAFGLSRWLRALVFEVEVTDTGVYAVVSVGLLAVAMLATWLPARRATAVDPVRAFRSE